MSIKVQFEIGHKAVLKAKKAGDNFTHDWELYVKGVDKADISSYIKKIVFILYESFPKPRRIPKPFKEPPFVLKQSGYAGFILPIDIHFKNKTMQTYQYDVHLHPSGPPVHKSEIKTHIFENPSKDFRQKLLKGGGILHGSLNEERIRVANTEFHHKLKTSSNSGNINSAHEDGKERKDDKHERRKYRERKKEKSHSKERDRSSDKSAKNRIESPQRKKPRILKQKCYFCS